MITCRTVGYIPSTTHFTALFCKSDLKSSCLNIFLRTSYIFSAILSFSGFPIHLSLKNRYRLTMQCDCLSACCQVLFHSVILGYESRETYEELRVKRYKTVNVVRGLYFVKKKKIKNICPLIPFSYNKIQMLQSSMHIEIFRFYPELVLLPVMDV